MSQNRDMGHPAFVVSQRPVIIGKFHRNIFLTRGGGTIFDPGFRGSSGLEDSLCMSIVPHSGLIICKSERK